LATRLILAFLVVSVERNCSTAERGVFSPAKRVEQKKKIEINGRI
jgi:hypothetical protein